MAVFKKVFLFAAAFPLLVVRKIVMIEYAVLRQSGGRKNAIFLCRTVTRINAGTSHRIIQGFCIKNLLMIELLC
jgi:predicted nucleic acid-binding protein